MNTTIKTTLLAVSLTATIMTGCSNRDADMLTDGTSETRTVTFSLSGDFGVRQEAMTRASLADAQLTDLWALDYASDGTMLQAVHQSGTDTDFGTVTMPLTYGHHDIKFVAARGEGASLTDNTTHIAPVAGSTAATLAWFRVKDTFALDYPVDVAASTTGSRDVELQRAVSGLKLVMTDAVPTNAKEIHITALRSLSLTLPSLAASDLAENTVTMAFPDSWRGTKDNVAITYTLCPMDEYTTDVRIRVLATDNTVISDFTVSDVSMRRNRMTTLTGEVFNRTSGFTISIDSEWNDDLNINF